MAIWQGDFGKGISTGSGVWSDPGANPCTAYGPVPATGMTGGGILLPPFKPGMTVNGDYGSEFILAKLVLTGPTDLLPGQLYQLDENFVATLLSTANSVLNAEIGVANIFASQLAAGTYYVWLQRAGHCAVQAAANSIATGQGETTATSGQLKFLAAGAHTAGAKSLQALTAFGASSSIGFTCNTTNGSPYLTNVVSNAVGGGVADLQVGMVITGAGFPANAIISAIDKQGGQWRITMGTNTPGSYPVPQNATATATGVAGTVTSHVVANVFWPTLNQQN